MIKLAFLFLTMTNISHEDYWRAFFNGHEDDYAVYVHAKHGVDANKWFKQFELPYTVENSWSRTMKSQIALIKEALKDPENQYFIFCSQNTFPLQSFDLVYNQLAPMGKSQFWYEKNPHMDPENKGAYQWYRVLKPIPEEKQYKNTQWVILNRKHAQMMADDEQVIRVVSHYPHDQEHYPSTFLSLHGMLDEVHKKENTLVVWHLNKKPPYLFNNLDNHHEFQLLTDAIRYGTLFVRKIGEHCDLSPLDPWLAYQD